jgi:hypothetical protein
MKNGAARKSCQYLFGSPESWRSIEQCATKITNSNLARRLEVRETVVRRMLDPNHATKSEKLQAALSTLGKRIVVALDDAAKSA